MRRLYKTRFTLLVVLLLLRFFLRRLLDEAIRSVSNTYKGEWQT
ncbi:Uncharacterised protein [Vibrio cholerae]|nr:Uncharacterised protein [Vibrio cholerae]